MQLSKLNLDSVPSAASKNQSSPFTKPMCPCPKAKIMINRMQKTSNIVSPMIGAHNSFAFRVLVDEVESWARTDARQGFHTKYPSTLVLLFELDETRSSM